MSELYASVASCKLPINDSFLSISLRNKTFNGVPEHVYIGDSERNALSLQYAKAYLRYIKPPSLAAARLKKRESRSPTRGCGFLSFFR